MRASLAEPTVDARRRTLALRFDTEQVRLILAVRAEARDASAEPRPERFLDLIAVTRGLEMRANTSPIDHDERRDALDLEVLHEIGPRLCADSNQSERIVVLPALKHLRQVSLDAPRRARRLPVEEHEPRALLGGDEQRGGICGHSRKSPARVFAKRR